MSTVVRTNVYSMARAQVDTGDVILLRGGWKPFQLITQLVTWSPYVHAGIVVELDGGMWVAELRAGGFSLWPLSRYQEDNWDAFQCPVSDRAKVKRLILQHVREGAAYDWVDLLIIAWEKFVGAKLVGYADDEKKVCSSIVAHILLETDEWHPFDLPVRATPGDLARLLTSRLSIEFRGRPE